jgi:hypothetical protein
MSRHISIAPTGRHAIAQGNALVIMPHRFQALKGRNFGRASTPSPVPPLQGGIFLPHDSHGAAIRTQGFTGLSHFAPLGRDTLSSKPMALPWAIACRPVGAMIQQPETI